MVSSQLAVMLFYVVGWTALIKADDMETSIGSTQYLIAEAGKDITLHCYYSNPSLSFYIVNRVDWAFTNSKNTTAPLTSGFYPVPEKEEDFEEGIYQLSFSSSSSTGFGFILTKNDVSPADEGLYTCSLLRSNGTVTRLYSARVDVLQP